MQSPLSSHAASGQGLTCCKPATPSSSINRRSIRLGRLVWSASRRSSKAGLSNALQHGLASGGQPNINAVPVLRSLLQGLPCQQGVCGACRQQQQALPRHSLQAAAPQLSADRQHPRHPPHVVSATIKDTTLPQSSSMPQRAATGVAAWHDMLAQTAILASRTARLQTAAQAAQVASPPEGVPHDPPTAEETSHRLHNNRQVSASSNSSKTVGRIEDMSSLRDTRPARRGTLFGQPQQTQQGWPHQSTQENMHQFDKDDAAWQDCSERSTTAGRWHSKFRDSTNGTQPLAAAYGGQPNSSFPTPQRPQTPRSTPRFQPRLLTSQIQACESWQQLAQLHEAHRSDMDHIHVAAMCRRLLVVLSPDKYDRSSLYTLRSSSSADQQAASNLRPLSPPHNRQLRQHHSSAMQSGDASSIQSPTALLLLLLADILVRLRELRVRECSGLLWSLSRLCCEGWILGRHGKALVVSVPGVPVEERQPLQVFAETWQALISRYLHVLPAADAQSLSNVLWAAAHLHCYSRTATATASATTSSSASTLAAAGPVSSPQPLSTSEQLMRMPQPSMQPLRDLQQVILPLDAAAKLLRRLPALLPRYEPQHLSNTIWAIAKLGIAGHSPASASAHLEQQGAAMLDGGTSAALARDAWLLPFMAVVEQQLAASLAAAQEAVAIRRRLAGTAASGRTEGPGSASFDLGGTASRSRLAGTAADNKTLATGSASLVHGNGASQFRHSEASAGAAWGRRPLSLGSGQAALQIRSTRLGFTNGQQFSNITYALATMGAQPGREWMLLYLRATARAMADGMFDGQQLVNMLWALARMRVLPPPVWMHRCCKAMQPKLISAAPQELSMLLHSLAVLQYKPPKLLLAAALDAVLIRRARMSSQAHANVLWSLATLGCPPPAAWLQPFFATAYHKLLLRRPVQAQAVAAILWAVAKLRYDPGPHRVHQLLLLLGMRNGQLAVAGGSQLSVASQPYSAKTHDEALGNEGLVLGPGRTSEFGIQIYSGHGDEDVVLDESSPVFELNPIMQRQVQYACDMLGYSCTIAQT